MKKTLALVLAFALVFSTMTVAFADNAALSADAKVCADLGMLVGDGNGVTAAYTATAPNRIQSAVMFLRLKGLEAEAKAFTGEANFADADKAAWAKPIMAYLKANPQLGWQGDGTNFNPTNAITAKEYYKVMLQGLGYVQSSATVAGGDFSWDNVIEFAATKGLAKAATVASFTINDVAVATVEALKANMKEGGKTLVASLVAAGKVDAAKATAAGIYTAAPVAPAVAVDKAEAVGNTSVDVTYEDDVDASAATASLYTIEGLEVKSAAVVDTDKVRLETAAMTTGKIYKLTVGGKTVQYAGIAKVSGAPEIDNTVSADVEEVVITFSKDIDLASGSNVANYSIAGVEIAKAVVDGKDVTLTTVGLKDKTKYTVKVTNVKSVDGTVKKSVTDSFTSRFDKTAPKIASTNGAVPETNQRIVVTFNEKVTKASAENLANYSLKVDEKDGAALEVVSAKWDSDDEDNVTLVTETMEKNEDYVLSVNGIADQRKAANTMTRPSTADIKGKAEDTKAPRLANATAPATNKVLVTFEDDSRIDAASATDLNNYTLGDLNIDEAVIIQDDYQTLRVMLTTEDMETGKSYDLKVTGVEDEFQNSMEESKKSVRPSTTSIATVKVNSVTVTGENTIEVVFSDEVDEASAENIANYSVNHDIGAPTKAEYEKTGHVANSVTLTVADLIDGWDDYALTVKGVYDLAGNMLSYVDVAATNVAKWETKAPEIEDAQALNNKVVAVTFDSMVQYQTSGQLILAMGGQNGNLITLNAADYDEDDTIVEFTYAATLPENVDYHVYQFVYASGDGGITDKIGNPVLKTDVYTADVTFNGNNDAPAGLEYDSIEQIDAKTFEVTFPRNVTITPGTIVGANSDFTVSYHINSDATLDKTMIRLTKNTGILTDGEDYKFNFAAFIKDYHNIAVANDDDQLNETVCTAEYTDEDAPYVNEVYAKNRMTIVIKFNERIDETMFAPSDFSLKLKNYDLDENVTVTAITKTADNNGEIRLTVSTPLEARYEYQLTIDKNLTKDFANLDNTEDTFYFDGTNLQ